MIYFAAVVGLSVLAVASYAAGVFLDPRWIVQARRHRILVHLTDGQTIKGVLVESDRESVVLASAEYLTSTGSTAMAGDVWVPRRLVRFIQSIPEDV